MITTENLTVRFGTEPLFENVNIKVRKFVDFDIITFVHFDIDIYTVFFKGCN